MSIAAQLAKHLRDVHFGGNWTSVNLKDTLADVTWQQATTKVQDFNTLATFLFHMNYFIVVATRVLQGGPLEGKDALSFDHPPIHNQGDWQKLLDKTWAEAETFAGLIDQVPDSKLEETFVEAKYGTYYRNLQGIIEHTHYHLGQIVIIKRLILEGK